MLSPRRLPWLLLKAEEELSAEERGHLQRLEESVADVAAARALARHFVGMMRDREPERPDGRLQVASGGPPELRSFVEELRRAGIIHGTSGHTASSKE